MNKQEILEGNKLIAEFMDIVPIKGFNEHTGKDYWYYNNSEMKDYEALPDYNFSWDWLMPVIEKINMLHYDVEINSGLRRINISVTDVGLCDDIPEYNEEFRGNSSLYSNLSNIECVFTAIVEFIKWYNQQKQL